MARYFIRSDYGTFAVARTVFADSFEEAYEQTGIRTDLVHAGWQVVEDPEGETHTIENLDTHEIQVYGG